MNYMKTVVRRVKLVSGLLSADSQLLESSKKILQKYYGPIDLESSIVPFDFTNYYDKELGSGILRQFVSFSKLICPESISKIKLNTIHIEKKKFSVDCNRKVNIDPGFIALDKLVVVTTKDATYRVYLGRKIYAQSMLYFQDKTYNDWPWTYQDYKTEIAIKFFNNVREIYRKQL